VRDGRIQVAHRTLGVSGQVELLATHHLTA